MNRKYYIVLPYQRKGPYNIEELKKIGINSETLIWAFEFNEPVKAGDIPELKPLLEVANLSTEETPPPPPPVEVKEEKTEEIKETNEQEEIIPEKQEIKEEETISEEEITFEEEKVEEKETVKKELEKKPVEGAIPPTPIPTMVSYEKEENTEQKTFDNIKNNLNNEKPKDYIVWSILSLVFCWNIIGIVSLITGIIANNQYNAGDYETAQKMSKTTLIILLVSLGLAIFTYLIIIAIAVTTSR